MNIKKKDLKQIYFLKMEITMWKERLAELDKDFAPGSKPIDGMPFANTNETSSPTEDKALKRYEFTQKLDKRVEELENTVRRVEEFILSLDDSILRQILELRCVRCMSWKAIAKKIGSGYTDESVRQTYKRFLKRLEDGKYVG